MSARDSRCERQHQLRITSAPGKAEWILSPLVTSSTSTNLDSMDPLSITASCFTLAATITRVSYQVTEFVREVRDARSDLDAVARELLSIKTVLEILADDAKDPAQNNFPPTLGRQVTGILANCNDVVAQIERLLSSYQGSRLTKGTKWALNGRGDAGKLRSTLEAHKTALDIALDMVALYLYMSPSAILILTALSDRLLVRSNPILKKSYKTLPPYETILL